MQSVFIVIIIYYAWRLNTGCKVWKKQLSW